MTHPIALGCLAVLSVIRFAGCSTNPLQDTPDEGKPFEVAKSSSVTREDTPVAAPLLEAQAQSNNRFAVALFQQSVQKDGNVFLSPYSVSAALAMAAAGAAGTTEQQMREALSVTLPGDDFHAALNGLGQSISSHARTTGGIQLTVVNSAWAQHDWSFQQAYLDRIARYYGAGVNLVDFREKPDRSRVLINDWVSEQTKERINDLLPEGSVTPLTRLVLTNAIYFLGDWILQFDPDLTRERPFHRLDGTTVQAPLMTLGEPGKKIELRWARQEQVRILELSYRGDRLAMSLLLPDEGHYRQFESTLTADRIDELTGSLVPTQLPPVQIPRFTFNTGSISLEEGLRALGMEDAFLPGAANFSGIDGSRELYISAVVHQAFIAVDEQGTEAAAATGVAIGVTSVPVDPPQFVADRPFVFLIRDTQTNTILFIGRVLDPS